MSRYWSVLLFCLLGCLPARAEVSCPTATINDDSELMALQRDIDSKRAALQKKMDDKCVPLGLELNRQWMKETAAIENKEGEYKNLSKKEREALILDKKYEFYANSTKLSKECYGEEGKLIQEYRDCLKSISVQHKYLQEEYKRKEKAAAEEKAAEKAAAEKAAQEEPKASSSAQPVSDSSKNADKTETAAGGQTAGNPAPSATEANKASGNVEVPGMVTSSTDNKQPASSATAAASSSSTGSSGSSSSASSSGSASSRGLFSDLTNKGLQIFGGLREIIYAVSGFGVLAVAIGGFFGVMNWRWLVAIIIGLMVVASASSIINYMVDSEVISDTAITDSLIDGA